MSYLTNSKYERLMSQIPQPRQEVSLPRTIFAMAANGIARAMALAVCIPASGRFSGRG